MGDVTGPKIEISKLSHEPDCGVFNCTYIEDAAARDCTCGAVVRWYEAVLQAVFDPENQPSQYGTTSASTIERLTAENERLRETIPSEDDLVAFIEAWFTEEWRSDAGDRWKEDVLLTGCRKVGGGRGYQRPDEAADNLRRDLARAIHTRLAAALPQHHQGAEGGK